MPTPIPQPVAEIVPVVANHDGSTKSAVVVTPTQMRRPWRSTIRTALQVAIPTIIALGLVVPQVVQIILEETGDHLPDGFRTVLLGISAAVVIVSAILARIMALPQVEALLRRFLPFLAAAPKS